MTSRRRPAARLPLALAGLLALASLVTARLDAQTTYDIVLHGGRVLDPESGLDAVRDVGISGRRIAAVSATPLHGRVDVDATGLVVAPGFIDLHSHGQTPENYRFKAMDGVTTALELEVGVSPVHRVVRGAGGEVAHQLRRQLRTHPGADGGDARHGRPAAARQRGDEGRDRRRAARDRRRRAHGPAAGRARHRHGHRVLPDWRRLPRSSTSSSSPRRSSGPSSSTCVPATSSPSSRK